MPPHDSSYPGTAVPARNMVCRNPAGMAKVPRDVQVPAAVQRQRHPTPIGAHAAQERADPGGGLLRRARLDFLDDARADDRFCARI